MTKKTCLSAILIAALAASSMAVSAIWLDHDGGTAGSIECHGYLYSYSATKYGADTTASARPYRVSVELSLSDGSGDFSIYYNRTPEDNHTSASVTVSAKGTDAINGVSAHHVVVADNGSFDGSTSYPKS